MLVWYFTVQNLLQYLCCVLGRRRNNGGRRQPLFPMDMWSVHDRVLHDQVRHLEFVQSTMPRKKAIGIVSTRLNTSLVISTRRLNVASAGKFFSENKRSILCQKSCKALLSMEQTLSSLHVFYCKKL